MILLRKLVAALGIAGMYFLSVMTRLVLWCKAKVGS